MTQVGRLPRALAAALAALWLAAAAPPAVAQQPAGSDGAAPRADEPAPAPPGDFPVPGGVFFTQAVPAQPDDPPGGDPAGFPVLDGHGAWLWTAFQAQGGVETLGYPISRRFEWDGRIAQAFQHGVLRWEPDADAAEVRAATELPDGAPPAYARQPDRPPRAAGEAERRPWSGWWWPASSGLGPALFAPGGPLDKYDRYVELATGENPGTREWERENVYFPGVGWAGHCNGFAAAALIEPEPSEPRELLGVTFSVGDLKALLSDYHFGDAAVWSFGDGGELSPADFHRALLDWLAGARRGFVITYDMGQGEVWSYPAYGFQSEWGPDPDQPGLWHVSTAVWMADMNVPPDFVGLQPYPGPNGKRFEYLLEGDPRHPTGGAWTGASQQGRFAHPGRIWYPEPLARNLDRAVASPNLDLRTLRNILAPPVNVAGAAPADGSS